MRDYQKFAEWVATEIFDDMWEYNKDAFAEIACRKLAKLGIVREKGDVWELVEDLEQEPCEDATLKDIFCMGCEYKEQESILDKIRTEIEAEPYISKIEVLDIIDKYKAEGSGEE